MSSLKCFETEATFKSNSDVERLDNMLACISIGKFVMCDTGLSFCVLLLQDSVLSVGCFLLAVFRSVFQIDSRSLIDKPLAVWTKF